MNKDIADKIITKYMKKIYGFALSKNLGIDNAEELASRIIFEVYKSLLTSSTIHSLDKYIYRCACNVYSKFLKEEMQENQVKKSTVESNYDQMLLEDKTYARLREEIAYLSKNEREIVYLYYYEKLSVSDIANKLNFSKSKVKWYLFEARNQLKNNLIQKPIMKNLQNVIFYNMRHFGTLGPQQIDLSFYFANSISQKIIYTTYHKAKTTAEIARDINVPAVFVEDEITILHNTGFLEKLHANKYLSTVFIETITDVKKEQQDVLFNQFAKYVADKYINTLFKTVRTISKDFLYYPAEDINFLMYSIISYIIFKKFNFKEKMADLLTYCSERLDGGNYIALANVNNYMSHKISEPCFSYNYSDLSHNFDYTDGKHITTWQLFSKFDSRYEKYSIWNTMLFETLYEYIIGKINNSPCHLDKFVRLVNNGYVVARKNEDFLNLVLCRTTQEEFIKYFPTVPDDIINYSSQLDDEIVNLNIKNIPAHMADLYKINVRNSFTSGKLRVAILDYLLKIGKLHPLKKYQKQTVNMIMFVK